jgi:hypothetical protein
VLTPSAFCSGGGFQANANLGAGAASGLDGHFSAQGRGATAQGSKAKTIARHGCGIETRPIVVHLKHGVAIASDKTHRDAPGTGVTEAVAEGLAKEGGQLQRLVRAEPGRQRLVAFQLNSGRGGGAEALNGGCQHSGKAGVMPGRLRGK